MIIESNSENRFNSDLSKYEFLGFHGTSRAASAQIESVGFLPHKIFSKQDHDKVLHASMRLGMDISGYQEWLNLRSVTFSLDAQEAINHVFSGHAGGHGLYNMNDLLRAIAEHGNDNEKDISRDLSERIAIIRNDDFVVYAVDLSGLGPRLSPDQNRRRLMYYRWNPDPTVPIPITSEIDPTRIIARLDLQKVGRTP